MNYGKYWLGGVVMLGAGFIGCSSETPTAQKSPAPPAQAAEANAEANQQDIPAPTDIVSRFLDQIRRGGPQVEASSLMTSKAQSECQRTGLVLQPIGSPETRYEVTRSELVPGTNDAALVHSVLTEPTAEDGGEPTSYQVVWALRRETVGWRISGLALEVEPGQEPLVVDFENGNDAARKLGVDIAPAQQPGERQAAEDTETEVR